jgi:hypothetical protein
MSYRPKPHQHPGWSINSGSYATLPYEISRWEKFLEAENLDEKDLKNNNPKVMDFIKKNAEKFYVPTKVLKMYGVSCEG